MPRRVVIDPSPRHARSASSTPARHRDRGAAGEPTEYDDSLVYLDPPERTSHPEPDAQLGAEPDETTRRGTGRRASARRESAHRESGRDAAGRESARRKTTWRDRRDFVERDTSAPAADRGRSDAG